MIISRLFLAVLSSGPLGQAFSPPALPSIDLVSLPQNSTWRGDVLKALDIQIEPKSSGSSRVVVMVDRERLKAALPALQAHGAISGRITQQDVAKSPLFYANAFALRLVSWAVQDRYAADADFGPSRWTALLTPAPEGFTSQEMFSFAFDRSVYQTLDWDKVSFLNFPERALAFRYNLKFTWQMAREANGGIAED